ncbi:TonB-dependent receptor domain-containing protein [Paucibacter sp. KBW04]|uniref:TonB-dependent receptor domain-containing protein n=1 Tax=Paucibacter sp. KBW04 TaxID=2153361 RepID=UPI0018CC5BC3|nr:TonB-dependent receptor [Paucibacter sp. KBW04]
MLAAAAEQLERVTVSASASARALADAPASITVITREQLEREPVASLEDALRRVEGVSVVGSGPNDQDINLRGMPGEYTLILVDGRRQNTRETMNRGTGGVQAFWMPPVAAIERIEIVRGPMSALYGADAMGGVINIITRKQIARWSGSLGLGLTQQSGDRRLGDSRQGDFWVGGPLAQGLSLQLWGGRNQREEDQLYYPISTTAGAAAQTQQNLGAKLGLQLGEGQQLALELGQGQLRRENHAGQSIGPKEADYDNEQTRDYWALSHSAQVLQGGRWRSALYRESGQQNNWTAGKPSELEPRVSNTVLDSVLTLPLDAHSLSLGLQWQRNELSGVAQEASVKGHASSPAQIKTDAAALFAEDEIELSPALALTLGLRADRESRYGTHWSPRVYSVYKLAQGWSLRGGVGSGFKAPKLRQAEASYCMSTGGNTPRRGSLCGNPDLKPETSRSAELGLRWDGQRGNSLVATLFHNDFRNKVVSYNTGKVDPLNKALDIYVYDNVDRVKLQGLELAGAWAFSPSWSLNGNYSYTDSQRDGGRETSFEGSSLDGRPLDKTPKHMASLRLDWRGPMGLQGFVRANYEGEQYWAGLRNGARGVRERPALATLDLGGSYAINEQLSLSAALINLGNRQVAVDDRNRNTGLDGNWQIDEGRRFWLRLGAQF